MIIQNRLVVVVEKTTELLIRRALFINLPTRRNSNSIHSSRLALIKITKNGNIFYEEMKSRAPLSIIRMIILKQMVILKMGFIMGFIFH